MSTTRQTAYVVQTFFPQGRGFRRGEAKRLDSQPQALRLGGEWAAAAPGVVVLEFECDESVDYCGEPKVIARYGEVPEAAL